MLDADYIAAHLRGAWQIMLGRKEGLQFIDISENGFWRSLQAVPVALPPLILSWSTTAREIAGSSDMSIPTATMRLGAIEIVVWFLPIIVLAYAARPLGFANRFVAFFVANNWASAVLSYLASPFDILRLLAPNADAAISIAGLVVLALVIVLFGRLIRVTLDTSWAATAAIFLFLLTSSIFLGEILEGAFGLAYPSAPPSG